MEQQNGEQTEVLATEFTVPFKPIYTCMATKWVVLPSPLAHLRVPADSLVSAFGIVLPL